MNYLYLVALALGIPPQSTIAEDVAYPYRDGVAQAMELRLPLYTYVGSRVPERVPNAIVAYAKTLEGFADGDLVISEWRGGKHVWIRTISKGFTNSPTYYSAPVYAPVYTPMYAPRAISGGVQIQWNGRFTRGDICIGSG